MHDTADHPAVINPRHAACILGQKHFKPGKLLLCQPKEIRHANAPGCFSDPIAGPLFAAHAAEDDKASGTIYVLRSNADLPIVKENRDILHKVGVTRGRVDKRIANARHDATYLLAEVEVVATYELYNINPVKLENLIHRFFEAVQLEIEIIDRFGKPVIPREWFLVPLSVINEVVEKIRDGTITSYAYDPGTAMLKSAVGRRA